MNLDFIDDRNKEENRLFFRRMRNEIVGSVENKLEYLKTNDFKR
jgi:hypothetical protein